MRRTEAESGNRIHPRVPHGWSRHLAYVISQIGSPPVLTLAVLALTASTTPHPNAWIWAGTYAILAILTPMVYLIWLMSQGRVTDLDVQLRQERARPMLFTLASGGVGVMVMALGMAPSELLILSGGLWLQSLIIFAITLRWKISVHSATATGAAAMIWFLTGALLPLVVGVPIIAWSRVRLRRHTVAQTIAGALVSLLVFVAAFLIC
jgi:membrane-associated phospholipid phosphatase